MKTKYILSALLAAGLATAAHAQSVVGDLVVGLEQTGNSTNYEIDLGSLGSYQGLAPGSVVNLSADLSSADLSSLFGANWASAGNVSWGGAATNGSSTLAGVTGPAKSDWVSQFDSVQASVTNLNINALPASAYKDAAVATANEREIAIQGLETGLVGTNGFVQSLNTSNLTGTVPAANASWTHEVTATNNGFVSPQIDAGTALSLGAGQFSIVDLYQYIQGATTTAGVYLGSLELGSNGSLFFTTATAIPEPSVYAAILGVATLAFVAIRRRKQQTLA
jgi:hypothetical protein